MWYTIIWFGIDGNPVRCEALHRDSIDKVWAFLEGRLRMKRIPKDATGFWFRESVPDTIETLDEDFGMEPRIPSNHADDIGVWDTAPYIYQEPQFVGD